MAEPTGMVLLVALLSVKNWVGGCLLPTMALSSPCV
jgi:hypothetical protein